MDGETERRVDEGDGETGAQHEFARTHGRTGGADRERGRQAVAEGRDCGRDRGGKDAAGLRAVRHGTRSGVQKERPDRCQEAGRPEDSDRHRSVRCAGGAGSCEREGSRRRESAVGLGQCFPNAIEGHSVLAGQGAGAASRGQWSAGSRSPGWWQGGPAARQPQPNSRAAEKGPEEQALVLLIPVPGGGARWWWESLPG